MITYVPILKWKQGEHFALKNLEHATKEKMCPFFSLVNIPECDKLIKSITRFWDKSLPFYLGFHDNLYEEKTNKISLKAIKLAKELIEKAKEQDIYLIPRVRSDDEDLFLEVLKDSSVNNYLIHLMPDDFDDVKNKIDNLLTKLNRESKNIDILVDLNMITPSTNLKLLITMVKAVLKNLESYGFRRIIFAASSFPDTLKVKQNDITKIKRLEWDIWKELYKSNKNINFGDFGVDDPLDIQIDSKVNIVPTVRYTYDSFFYIYRGKYDPQKPYDFSQYHLLCKSIIRSENYCGKTFSWGDEEIFECANTPCRITKCNHGNPNQWVKRSTNHHLKYVVSQLSTF